MANSLPTWLRAFRLLAIVAAVFNLAYSLLFFEPGTSWAQVICSTILFTCSTLLGLAPWFFTSPAWLWWPNYGILAWMTYRISENVIDDWINHVETGVGGPFAAWSPEIKFMMIYASIAVVILIAQIVVLPFFRHLSSRPSPPLHPMPA